MKDVLLTITVVLFLVLLVVGLIAFAEGMHCPKCDSRHLVPIGGAALWKCWDCGHIFTAFDLWFVRPEESKPVR